MLYDFETNITELENVREREARNEVISNNYLSLISHNSHLLQQIGEKPISMDSFLDVCNILLEGQDKVEREKINSSVLSTIQNSIEILKLSFDYADLKNYDVETLTDVFKGFFNDFCITISNSTLKYNQYNIPTAIPVVYIQCILKAKGFDLDSDYVNEAFKEANRRYNTLNESGEKYIKNVFSNEVFNVKKDNSKISYDVDFEYQNLHAYCEETLKNKGNTVCKTYSEFLHKISYYDTLYHKARGYIFTPDYFNYSFPNCNYKREGKTGNIKIIKGYNIGDRLEALIEFTDNESGKKEYIYSKNLNNNLRTSKEAPYTIELETDNFSFKVDKYATLEEYIIKNERVDFDVNDKSLKEGISYNLGEISIPEVLVDKSSHNYYRKTYEITQCYLKNNNGTKNCHLVIKDKDNNYYLLKNMENNMKFVSIKKDKDFKISSILKDYSKDKER